MDNTEEKPVTSTLEVIGGILILLVLIVFLNSIIPISSPFSDNLFSDKYGSTISGRGFDPAGDGGGTIDDHTIVSQLHYTDTTNVQGNHNWASDTTFGLGNTHYATTIVHDIFSENGNNDNSEGAGNPLAPDWHTLFSEFHRTITSYDNPDSHTGDSSYHYSESRNSQHDVSSYVNVPNTDHLVNSDVHYWRSDSATHQGNTDEHQTSSTVHSIYSTVHMHTTEFTGNEHSEHTNYHESNSNTQTHSSNTDMHYSNSTNTHYPNSAMHFTNSSIHNRFTDGHFVNTATHNKNSVTHSINTDTHKTNSISHLVDSGEHTKDSQVHHSNSRVVDSLAIKPASSPST